MGTERVGMKDWGCRRDVVDKRYLHSFDLDRRKTSGDSERGIWAGREGGEDGCGSGGRPVRVKVGVGAMAAPVGFEGVWRS